MSDGRRPLRQERAHASRGHYSRFVSLMKVGLAVTALVMTALVVLWPHLQGAAEDLITIGFADLRERVSPTQRMVNARYQGADAGGRPYAVTAAVAEETAPGSPLVSLETPKADMILRDGAWVMAAGNAGLYDQTSGDIDLWGGVDVFHDGGFEMHTERIVVNPTAGTARSTVPTKAQGPVGIITAEGFTYDHEAGRMVFTGRARMILHPNAGAARVGTVQEASP